MGSYDENMDQFDFDPAEAKFSPKSFETGSGMSSEQLYGSGAEREYDPSQSKLVAKTSRYQNGCTSTAEQAYKNGQEFDFDPASGRLLFKQEPIHEVEEQMRNPSSDKDLGFDKKKKRIKVEKETKPRRDREVKVDMNKRGTGGFF